MTYIALVPKERKFLGEHLTLVWMGLGQGMPSERVTAGHLIALINDYIRATERDPSLEKITLGIFGYQDRPYQLFGQVMVATGRASAPIQQFRTMAELLGLDHSAHRPWTPHITGEQGHWRRPGERVFFTHAELR